MKKGLALCMAAALAMGCLLTGCGSSDTGAKSTTESAAASTETVGTETAGTEAAGTETAGNGKPEDSFLLTFQMSFCLQNTVHLPFFPVLLPHHIF